jgi:MtN3 and saliva related transmembrane protein
MNTETIIAVLGIVGGFCTTFAFVPQVIKIWKQGGRDLSYGMLALYLFGVLLWLAYGVLLHAPAIIWTNAATAILIAFATISKAWTDRRDIVKETLPAHVAGRG